MKILGKGSVIFFIPTTTFHHTVSRFHSFVILNSLVVQKTYQKKNVPEVLNVHMNEIYKKLTTGQ